MSSLCTPTPAVERRLRSRDRLEDREMARLLDNRIRPDLVTVCAYRDTFNEVVRIAAENEQ